MILRHSASSHHVRPAVALAIALVGSQFIVAYAAAEEVSTVLQLTPATAIENTFDIRVEVLGSEDTQSVVYGGILRPVMNIDFSDALAPVVNTLDFVGVVSDIEHSDATFSVPLGSADFTNITGRLQTAPGQSPGAVVGGTTFNSSDHQLIAWNGTIDITPFIGGTTSINLNTSTFTGTFNGTDDSTINVAFHSLGTGVQTYDVDITTALDDVRITTGDPEIDTLLGIFITGNLVANGQFTRRIPEPASAALVATLAGGLVLGRSARRLRRRIRIKN